jgi:hypothetical protein
MVLTIGPYGPGSSDFKMYNIDVANRAVSPSLLMSVSQHRNTHVGDDTFGLMRTVALTIDPDGERGLSTSWRRPGPLPPCS